MFYHRGIAELPSQRRTNPAPTRAPQTNTRNVNLRVRKVIVCGRRIAFPKEPPSRQQLPIDLARQKRCSVCPHFSKRFLRFALLVSKDRIITGRPNGLIKLSKPLLHRLPLIPVNVTRPESPCAGHDHRNRGHRYKDFPPSGHGQGWPRLLNLATVRVCVQAD